MKEFAPCDIHQNILNKLTFNSIKYIPVGPYSSAAYGIKMYVYFSKANPISVLT